MVTDDDPLWGSLSGTHRVQRMAHGGSKKHTSTVTFAALTSQPPQPVRAHTVDEKDIAEQFYRGTGRGGQRRNKVSTAVRIVHLPTGLEVHTERGRSQAGNRQQVRDRLGGRLLELSIAEAAKREQESRLEQIQRVSDSRVFTHNKQRATVSGPGVAWTWKEFYSGRLR